MTQQTFGGEEAVCVSAVSPAVRSKEVIMLLYLAFLGHFLTLLSSFGLLIKEK